MKWSLRADGQLTLKQTISVLAMSTLDQAYWFSLHVLLCPQSGEDKLIKELLAYLTDYVFS